MSVPNERAHQGTVDSLVHIPLFLQSGEGSYSTVPRVIAAGQILPTGAVLGEADTGPDAGMVKLSDPAATDGSQKPRFVNVHRINTAASGANGPVNLSVATGGMLNEAALVYAPGWTMLDLKIALRAVGFGVKSQGFSG
ncbi:head decoration protein [Phreatobacter aquaticus]|uniref:Head decoration protein n=1 Tax=Phreatobacter aquaticus TaxID=2570229 RepID=A0A4D7QMQ1_9HYPH|nr:head decoration protein [Phreatobacter aquaticus]QCK87253.1 head decoration protein [Phreatobacter aquaticus]